MPKGPAFPEQTRAAAETLIAQYGEDAEVIATLRAAEFAAMGDRKGLADWDDIIACVAALQAGGQQGIGLLLADGVCSSRLRPGSARIWRQQRN